MMISISIQGEQTLFDIAIQEYGKADYEALWKLLDDNPDIAFDYKAMQTDAVAEERVLVDNYEIIESGFKDIAYPLTEGQSINIDSDYSGKDNNVLKQIEGSVIATGYAEPINN
ncbi:MAG: hypothetical protein JEY96_17020 [Bacteroidales bacterium]|nr:hypothetical protein [Bacteroidales bacterium]